MSRAGNQEELIRQHLRLDPASPSGVVWLATGQPALTRIHNAGYLVGSVCSREVLAHRAVYLLAHGALPPVVDHRNGNKQDNRIENLRGISQAGNQHNRRVAKGYCFYKPRGTYVVNIMVHGKRVCGGYFKTEEQARARYLELKAIHHPDAEPHCYEPDAP